MPLMPYDPGGAKLAPSLERSQERFYKWLDENEPEPGPEREREEGPRPPPEKDPEDDVGGSFDDEEPADDEDEEEPEPEPPKGDFPVPPTDTGAAFDPEGGDRPNRFSGLPGKVRRAMRIGGIGIASFDPTGDDDRNGKRRPGIRGPRGPAGRQDPESDDGSSGGPPRGVLRPRGAATPNPETDGGPTGPAFLPAPRALR